MDPVFSPVGFPVFFRHATPESEWFVFEGVVEAFFPYFALSADLSRGFHFLDKSGLVFFRVESRCFYGSAIRQIHPREIDA